MCDVTGLAPSEEPETSFLVISPCRCASASVFFVVIWLTVPSARIFANQPLRAREANGYISEKYPVIVSRGHWTRVRRLLLICRRITSTMPSLLVQEVLVSGPPSVSRKPVSTPPVYQSSSPQEVTLLPLRVVSMLLLESTSNSRVAPEKTRP